MDGNYFSADASSVKVIDAKDSPLTDKIFGEKQISDNQLEIDLSSDTDLAEFARDHSSHEIYYEIEQLSLMWRNGQASNPALTGRLPVYWSGLVVTPALENNPQYLDMLRHRTKNRLIAYQIYLPVKANRTIDPKDNWPMFPYDLQHSPHDFSINYYIDGDLLSLDGIRVSGAYIGWDLVADAMKKAGLKVAPLTDY